MNKRQAMVRVLDYFIDDIQSGDHVEFYDDPETGEEVGEKDKQRLDAARDQLCWQLISRARRLDRRPAP